MDQEAKKYLDILVNDIHSTVIAKIKDNHPVTRVIDMMLYDDNGLYFLTGKGKEFYSQLMEQKYIALSSIKDKRSINLAGKVENIGYEKLDEIFEKSPYMKEILCVGKVLSKTKTDSLWISFHVFYPSFLSEREKERTPRLPSL